MLSSIGLWGPRIRLHAVLIPSFAMLLSGCAATVVKPDKPFVLEKKSVVVLRQGHELQARRVAVEADSLAVTGRYSGVETRIPMSKVGKVVELNAFSGMMRGAAGGTAIGAGVGLALVPIAISTCEGYGCFVIPMIPVITTLWGVGGGALAGLLYGRGAAYRFEGFESGGSGGRATPDTARDTARFVEIGFSPDSTVDSTRIVEDLPDSDSALSAATSQAPPVPPDPVPVREWLASETDAKDSTRVAHRTQPRNRFYAGATGSAAFGSPPSGPGKAPPVTFGDGGPLVSLSLGTNVSPHWMAGLRYTTGFLEQQYRTSTGNTNFRESHLNEFQAEAFFFPRSLGPYLRAATGFSCYEFIEVRNGPVVHTGSGAAVSVGGGYAFRPARFVNLLVGVELTRTWYYDGADNLLVKPNLGVFWY